ncbi:FtsX-like permease family protein [Streptomyces sp. NPDC048611]|uniref:ABC transporter permease n=1 Tax=Streptomyces sp. NPDC048611 TaxID=3155635 RepID=UPI00344AB877
MLRTALRNVLAHKARLMMTALAVLLGVAFVTGTLIFSDTTGSAVQKASMRNLDGVAVSVKASEGPDATSRTGKDGKRSTLVDQKLADKIRALPGVQSVRTNVIGQATVAGPDNVPLGNGWQNLAGNFQPGKDGHDARYPLLKGRGPAAADELALDEATAKASGHKIGDSVRFATDGPVLTKKLVGIVSTDDPQVTSGGSLTLFDTATAQKLFVHPGQFDELLVGAAPGTDQQALTAKVSEVLPKDRATATSGKALAAEQSKSVALATNSLTQTLLSFAGIALFVGVFIIANTFTMLISQRSREIALMRAIGASRRQVVRAVLAEAALLGLISSGVGFALGIGLAVGLRAVLAANGAGFPDGPVVISPAAVLSALGVGVVVTVLAAWLPSRKAAKIAPVEALNTVEAPPALRSLVLRNSLGTVITGLGVATMFYVSTLEESDDLPIAMVGGVLMLTGVIILAPLLSRPLVSLAGVVTTRLFGISGKLAKENTLRNPRRTAATASALMIGLTLITGMTVVGNSAGQAMDKMTAQGLKADYKIGTTTYTGLDPERSQKVADLPGVEAAAPLSGTSFDTPESSMSLKGTDLSTIGKVVQLDLISGSLKGAGGNDIAVSEEMAKMKGWKTGDTLDGTFFDEKKAKLKIVGIFADNELLGDSIGAASTVAPHQYERNVETLLVNGKDGPSEGLEKQIRHALGDSPLLLVQDHADLRTENARSIEMVLNVSYGLLGMAVIIAVVGVVNTLAMSVFERTREIGMLRAIGLARSGIKQMVRLESVVIALFGAGLGIAVGVFCSWAVGNLVSQGMPTYELLLPWGRLALFVLIALVVGVLAALWPARRAARLNMLEAIGAQ